VTEKDSTAFASTVSTESASSGATAAPSSLKSSITIEGRKDDRDMKKGGRNRKSWKIHPGEILREEFLKPLHLSAYELAKRLRVPAPRINDIVLEKRGITADTALRLARFFNTTEAFWMNLQTCYEVRDVRSRVAKEINRIQPHRAETAA
jgi:antitoxin HigA-1